MYKALTSFSGVISMSMDEVRELTDKVLIDDLLKAGYIMEMKADKPIKKKKGESKNES